MRRDGKKAGRHENAIVLQNTVDWGAEATYTIKDDDQYRNDSEQTARKANEDNRLKLTLPV